MFNILDALFEHCSVTCDAARAFEFPDEPCQVFRVVAEVKKLHDQQDGLSHRQPWAGDGQPTPREKYFRK